MKNIINSPIEQITFNNQSFLLKRDDLLHPSFSGNKARKFYYFFKKDFPNITTLVSHGSNQSNAMYSLSSLSKLKGWRFIYYTNHIPSFLEQNPAGNYKYALENGMELIVGEYEFNSIKTDDKTKLYIDEGGAINKASYGLEILANEIIQYKIENNISDLKIFLPSGTGTTALFLQKFLDIEVLTCSCVGDTQYLQKQFLELESDISLHPTIVTTKKKYHFGKLYKENYEIYLELLKQTKIEFDLLYDPIGWNTLLNMYEKNNSTILYIHQGGIIGNETMLDRYKYKYDG
ncbi:MAG: 1-aminocyclopropane-1-carboxylate deaminase [Campylobacterota bacterium]|nr:1-aminocyclopropane-1-carboxylate deaminase [Campylobacterota bacterium]